MGQFLSPSESIDVARYPIADPESSQCRALAEDCRRRMTETGSLELPGFLSEAGLAAVRKECVQLEPSQFHSHVTGNAYLAPEDPTVPPDHPLRLTEPTALGVVAYDQFPRRSTIRAIYEWEPLMRFIGASLGLTEIHRYGDPLGGLNLAVMGDGDYLRWHFDQTDFVTSIAVRSAISGGRFEFVPMIRATGQENYDAVRKVIRGDHPGVISLPTSPGSLILFRGRHSIHRVTPISGDTTRLMLLLGYDTRPGIRGSEHLTKMRYGRVDPYPIAEN